jgi:ribosome recycling factor
MTTLEQKIIAAKAIRRSFNEAQRSLLKDSFMSDDYLIERLREAQDQYKCFRMLVDEIKEEDEDAYNRELVGI